MPPFKKRKILDIAKGVCKLGPYILHPARKSLPNVVSTGHIRLRFLERFRRIWYNRGCGMSAFRRTASDGYQEIFWQPDSFERKGGSAHRRKVPTTEYRARGMKCWCFFGSGDPGNSDSGEPDRFS